MKVQNLNGTGDKACYCGTWLEHWRLFNGETRKIPSKCTATDCNEPVGDGAHIKKCVLHDQRHYIVPLCKNVIKDQTFLIFLTKLRLRSQMSLKPAVSKGWL